MALPAPKSVAAPTVASNGDTSNAPVAVATKAKVAIKQFGKARTEPNAAGETQQIPAPKPAGVDLVEFAKAEHEAIKGKIVALGIDWDTFVTACTLDKPSIPGHKEGRATYAFANMVVGLDKVFGLLTKERGVGGVAKMKQVIEKKDKLLDTLKAKLLAMGQSEDEIAALLNA
jgi:hypothetical protein